GLLRAMGYRLTLNVGLDNVGAGDRHFRVELRNLGPCCLYSGLLFRAVEPENRRSGCDRAAEADERLGDAAIGFRNDRNGSVKERHVFRRWMIVKYGRDQKHR